MAATGLALPLISSEQVIVDDTAYHVGLYEANDRSRTNFVYAIHREGYLIRIGKLDGAAPAVVIGRKFPWPPSVFDVQFIQGGHQRTLTLFSLDPNGVREIGSIGSNAACIFHRSGKPGLLEALDEDRGTVTLTRYAVGKARIRRLGTTVITEAQGDNITALCEQYNVLGAPS